MNTQLESKAPTTKEDAGKTPSILDRLGTRGAKMVSGVLALSSLVIPNSFTPRAEAAELGGNTPLQQSLILDSKKVTTNIVSTVDIQNGVVTPPTSVSDFSVGSRGIVAFDQTFRIFPTRIPSLPPGVTNAHYTVFGQLIEFAPLGSAPINTADCQFGVAVVNYQDLVREGYLAGSRRLSPMMHSGEFKDGCRLDVVQVQGNVYWVQISVPDTENWKVRPDDAFFIGARSVKFEDPTYFPAAVFSGPEVSNERHRVVFRGGAGYPIRERSVSDFTEQKGGQHYVFAQVAYEEPIKPKEPISIPATIRAVPLDAADSGSALSPTTAKKAIEISWNIPEGFIGDVQVLQQDTVEGPSSVVATVPVTGNEPGGNYILGSPKEQGFFRLMGIPK